MTTSVELEAEFKVLLMALSVEDRDHLSRAMVIMSSEVVTPAIEAEIKTMPASIHKCLSYAYGLKILKQNEAESLEKKRQRDQPIKDIAVDILKSMIAANPAGDPAQMATQAMQAAQRIHDAG
jgi:hypothetical protein